MGEFQNSDCVSSDGAASDGASSDGDLGASAAMKLVLATANPDKAREIAEILGTKFELIARPDHVGDVEETGETLLDNARLKAVALMEATGMAAVADDTGLEVVALDGAPGVYSQRYAGENATYSDNVKKLLEAMDGVEKGKRGARFRTVALVAYPGGSEVWAEGEVTGTISEAARGSNGFGYDPVFVPEEGDRTFAEMTAEEKNRLSHRSRAFTSLAAKL